MFLLFPSRCVRKFTEICRAKRRFLETKTIAICIFLGTRRYIPKAAEASDLDSAEISENKEDSSLVWSKTVHLVVEMGRISHLIRCHLLSDIDVT